MRRRLPLAALALLVGMLPGCDDNPNSPSPAQAVFDVQACSDQTFRIRLTDAQLIQRAQSLVGQSQQPIVNGRLARGNGGFNEPWSWHLEPGSIEFADVTAEVCDGCPRMVEDNLDYWVNTVGRFCPWSSRIVRRVQ